MNRKICSIVAATLLLPCVSYAEDVKINVDLNKDLALLYPMSQGQPAPFPGVLLSPKAGSQVITEYNFFDDKLRLEVENAVSVARANFEFEKREIESKFTTERTTLQAQIASREEKIEIFDKDLKAAEGEIRRLKEEMPSRLTWFGVGAVSGIVFTIATAYAIGQLVN